MARKRPCQAAGQQALPNGSRFQSEAISVHPALCSASQHSGSPWTIHVLFQPILQQLSTFGRSYGGQATLPNSSRTTRCPCIVTKCASTCPRLTPCQLVTTAQILPKTPPISMLALTESRRASFVVASIASHCLFSLSE